MFFPTALHDLLRHGHGELRGTKETPTLAELRLRPDTRETPEAFFARVLALMEPGDEYSIIARERKIAYAVIYHPVSLPA